MSSTRAPMPPHLAPPAQGQAEDAKGTRSSSVVTSWGRILQTLGPPFLFMLLSAAFLWQPLATGRAFLPTDLSYKHDYVWRAHTGIPGASVAQNEILSDVSDYYYPYTWYAIQSLRSGRFPLWNPYILTGTPFFASTQAAVLDPINLLTYLAGPLDYWAWAAFLRLALIGYAMYGFVRALGRSVAGGIAAGAALMTCGFVTVWLNYSVVGTFTWLPLLLWATTRLMQTGRPIWVAATGAAMGALLLAGHPETQFLSGLVWGLYGLYWVARGWRNRVHSRNSKSLSLTSDVHGLNSSLQGSGSDELGQVVSSSHHVSRFTFPVTQAAPSSARRLLLLVGSAVLGIALGAVQVLTFGEFLLNSSAIGDRGGAAVPFDLGQSALRLAVTFFPNFGGNPTQENYWVSPFTNFNEQTAYIGLLTAALAVLGACVRLRRDRMALFFTVLGLVALFMELRVPGTDWVRSLPIFNIGHGVRWAMVWSLCGATLAAYGIDAISIGSRFKVQNLNQSLKGRVTQNSKLKTQNFRYALWFGGSAVVALAFLLVMYIGIRDGYWDRAWGSIYSHSKVTRIFHPAQLVLYLPVIFLACGSVVLLAGWRGWVRRGGVVALLILLLYAELWTTGSRYNPVTPGAAVYPATTVTDYLSQNLGHERFAGLENTLRPNIGMTFGVHDMRGYEDVVDQSHDVLYGRFKNILKLTNEPDLKLTGNLQRLLNMASVKYLLSLRKPRVDGDAKFYRAILQDDKVALYENLQVLPRAYVVYGSQVVGQDPKTAKAALLSALNDPRLSVVLDEGDALSSSVSDPSSLTPNVLWLRDDPEQIELSVVASARGYLVLSDSYMQGWEATVDGQPAAIQRANVVFRAVEVPVGKHTVSFFYRPPLFYIGAIISGLSMLTIFIIALAHLLWRRRSPNQV